MSTQDTLSSDICRRARERLISLADEARLLGRCDLARSIEDAATRGIDETCAELLATAPALAPAQVDWDWLPNDWVIAARDLDGSLLTYWTWLPVGDSS